MRRAPLPVLLAIAAAAAGPARAGDVVSPAADSVAVTVYRDQPLRTAELLRLGESDTHGLALIVETREVDLPAGRSRLRFEGVADGIIPQSAGIEGLPARIVERNFDYDLLTPGALIERSVGRPVRLVRTDARTGRESSVAAVLRSGPDGVVLDEAGRIEALGCGGERERLVFDTIPDGLAARPTLSLAVNAPSAGRYKVRLSYLTVRMDWTADYVATLSPDADSLALTGWITLSNRTGSSFEKAPTEVVAGHLARAPVDLPAPRLARRADQCWPLGTTHGPWAARLQAMGLASDMSVNAPAAAPMLFEAKAGMRMVEMRKLAIESQLGDYKLYTLPEPTTVAARQTKQVAFLDQSAVRVRTVYAHTVEPPDAGPDDAAAPEPQVEAAHAVLRLKNTADQGLGRPLPSGSVQVRQAGAGPGGRGLLVGEPALERDVPVGEPFELDLGEASDVTVTDRLVSSTPLGTRRLRRAFEIEAANARSAPVTVEIRHDRAGAAGFRVVAESDRHGDKAGDPLWRITVPANGRRTLTYAIETAAS